MSQWDDYRAFRHVLRRRSYALGAADLGVAPATARAAVERLGERIGAALFLHAPDGLAPTAAAIELGRIADDMADAVGGFERMASGGLEAVAGRVKVAVYREDILAHALLTPAIGAVLRRYPALSIDLALGLDWGRLRARACDVAVGVTAVDHPGLDVRRAARLKIGLYGHRRYLAEAASVASAGNLPRFAIVRPRGAAGADVFLSALGLSENDLDGAVECEDRAAVSTAIRLGLGIGAFPEAVALAETDLEPVRPEISVRIDLMVAIRQDDQDVRRIVAVRDAVVENLTQYDVA